MLSFQNELNITETTYDIHEHVIEEGLLQSGHIRRSPLSKKTTSQSGIKLTLSSAGRSQGLQVTRN